MSAGEGPLIRIRLSREIPDDELERTRRLLHRIQARRTDAEIGISMILRLIEELQRRRAEDVEDLDMFDLAEGDVEGDG